MSDEGTSFTIDIPVTGVSAIDAAAASADTLAGKLDAVSKAVKAGEAAYRQAETSSNRAAKALERIGLAAEAQRGKLQAALKAGDDKAFWKAAGALNALNNKQVEAAKKADAMKAALEKEAAALDALKAGAKKIDAAVEAAKKGEINFEGLRRGLNKLGGPLAELGNRALDIGAGIQKLSKNLGSMTGLALGATAVVLGLVAAFIAAAAAAATMAVKVIALGVTLADTNRTNELLAQGMLRWSRTGGKELNDKINFLTSRLPLTRDEIASTAEQLAQAGYRGKALSDALQTLTVRAANLKFGPNWEKQMLSLSEQSKILQYNVSRIFGGLKVEGALKALQNLGDLLDEDTASGRAIKAVFEAIFQPLLDGLVAAEPKIERFFLKLEVYALKALIWFKPHASLLLKIGAAFALAGVLIVTVFAAALAFVLLPLAALVAMIAGAIFVVIQFWGAIVKGAKAVQSFFETFSLADMGRKMIDGLVKGIKNGATAVVDAVKGVVSGAVEGAEKLLGIKSPSRRFMQIGLHTGEGMAIGVERSTPGVQSAMESMVSPPTAGASTAAPVAPAPAPAKGGANLQGASFHFYGVKDADDAESRFAAVMTRILEGDASQLGALTPEPA